LICHTSLVCVASGQDNESFKTAIDNAGSDSEKVNLLNERFLEIQYTNPQKTDSLVELSINIANKIGYKRGWYSLPFYSFSNLR